jgi:hypothetical protein
MMSRDRYGLKQVVASEFIKIASLRSTLWTLLIALAGTLGISAISANSATHHSPQWYTNFDPTNQALAGLLVAVLAVGVFGILACSGEYGSGTIRPSLAAVPDRRLLVAGKVLVVGGTCLVVGEVLTFVSFWVGQAILSGGGAPSASLGQPGVLRAVALSGVVVALLGLLGLGLGVLVRHTAGAISIYAGATFLIPFLLSRLPSRPSRYTPIPILANSISAVIPEPSQLTPTAGFLLVVAYAAVVVIAGAAIMVRRDA